VRDVLAAATNIPYPTWASTSSTTWAAEPDSDPAAGIEHGNDCRIGDTDASVSKVRRVRTRGGGFGLGSRRQPAWRDRPWGS